MTTPRLSPEVSPPTPGVSRLPNTKADGLGSLTPTPLATSGVEDGVPPTMGLPSCPSPLHSTSLPSSQVSGAQKGYSRRNRLSLEQGGNRRSRSEDARLLRSSLCGSEAVGGLPSGSRPLYPEHFSNQKEIQNGDCISSETIHSQGRLGHFPGPQRCLLPSSHPPEVQEVAPLREREPGVSVQSSPLRPLTGPLDLHPSHTGIVRQREEERDQTAGVFGRLADSSCIRSPLQSTHTLTRGPFSLPGIYFSPRKVFPHPFATVQLPGHELRLSEMDRFSLTRTDREVHRATGYPYESRIGFSSFSRCPTRSDGVSLTSSPSRSFTQEAATTSAQAEVESNNRLLGRTSFVGGLVQGGHFPMDGHQVVDQRRTDLSSYSSAGAIHRCVGGGLGSPLRRAFCIGDVVANPEVLAHQPSGNAGGSGSDTGSPPSSQFESDPSLYRQHHSSLLHQQARRLPVNIPLSEGRSYPPTMPDTGDQDSCQTCTGQGQHISRLPQQTSYGSPDGVDYHPQLPGTGVEGVGEAANRLVRHKVQQQASPLREPCHGSPSLESGRAVPLMGGPDSVCFSTHPDSEQGGTESEAGVPQNDSDSTRLASSTMVPRPNKPLTRTPIETTSWKEESRPTKVRHTPRQPSSSRSSRLATVRNQLQSSGVSSGALDLIAQAHRTSTQNSYDSCWKTWLRWCKDNKKDPVRPSKVHLANFLAFLHTGLKLSPSSIKVHKAAVCSSLRQLGRSSYSNDPLITSLIRGISQGSSARRVRVPAWDLFLVLAHLRNPPFEPVNTINLKFLTLKTVFLVSLATGRRCSEIHALSGQGFDIKYDLKNNNYTLKFLPEFLAKNQAPDQLSPSLCILPLETILAPDDRDVTLCPVRALRRYLHFTKTLRFGKRRLFISHNPSKVGDIRRPTISRWISEVIESAYKAEASDTAHTSSRAHELRALAASLHFNHSWRLQDVLEASFWRSRNSFIEFYLRDIEALRQDGSHGIASVVAAQRQVSTPRQA